MPFLFSAKVKAFETHYKTYFVGGLRADATDSNNPVFYFEEQQYDYPEGGYNAENTSHVSYFLWNKDAKQAVQKGTYYVEEYLAYYYTEAEIVECYAEHQDDYANILIRQIPDDVFFTNNPNFQVGTAPAGTYRTLTHEEWEYLFSYNESADNPDGKNYDNDIRRGRYKYGVKVCGKTNCVVLLPDNWDTGIISLTDFANKSEYNGESDPTWEEMEEGGAVCLPAAGNGDAGYQGYQEAWIGSYWSSTIMNDNPVSAYTEFFSEEVIIHGVGYEDSYRYEYSNSVRLVTEASGGYVPAVKVSSVSLNKTKTTIDLGDSETLVATVAPANAANKQVTWKSSDEDVATVENGVVTGVAVGSAVITATTIDGNFTAVCLVTVERLSLPGEFSINSNQDKIHFAKGNLYCSRTSSSSNDWTWHFYDEQYQYNNSYTQTDEYDALIAAASDTQIDLFTWGYDSEKSINPVGTDYVTGYATDGATFSKREDWGYVFGGNSSHWRTLTKDEWEYIISNRTNADDKIGFAEIGTVQGLVILPDTFTLPSECTFTSKSVDPSYENTYTQGDSGTWKAMEDAGAVFLPAVGRRIKSSELNNRGDICRYWSSSAKNGTNSYHLLANYKNEIQTGDSECSSGFSVRLVKQ